MGYESPPVGSSRGAGSAQSAARRLGSTSNTGRVSSSRSKDLGAGNGSSRFHETATSQESCHPHVCLKRGSGICSSPSEQRLIAGHPRFQIRITRAVHRCFDFILFSLPCHLKHLSHRQTPSLGPRGTVEEKRLSRVWMAQFDNIQRDASRCTAGMACGRASADQVAVPIDDTMKSTERLFPIFGCLISGIVDGHLFTG